MEIGTGYLTADSALILIYISDLLELLKHYTLEVTQYDPIDIVLMTYLMASSFSQTRRGGHFRTSVMSVEELSEKTGFTWIDLLNRISHSVQFSNSTRVAIEDIKYLNVLREVPGRAIRQFIGQSGHPQLLPGDNHLLEGCRVPGIDRTCLAHLTLLHSTLARPEKQTSLPTRLLRERPLHSTPDLPTAIKYGFFGSILAHEMTHAFDAVADHYSQVMGPRL